MGTPLMAIKTAASIVQVPFELLRAICTVESGLNPNAIHREDGHGHSIGMCQIKLSTAKMRPVGYSGTERGLFKPEVNAFFAAKYLNYQLQRYKGDWVKAISAYNSGTYTAKNPKYVNKVIKQILRQEKLRYE